jgi:hypothetical protein
MKSKFGSKLLGILAVFFCLFGCAKVKNRLQTNPNLGSEPKLQNGEVNQQIPKNSDLRPASDGEALLFLKGNCDGCHGPLAPAQRNQRSFWSMPDVFWLPLKGAAGDSFEGTISKPEEVQKLKNLLEVDPGWPRVYLSLQKKVNSQNAPDAKAMPPSELDPSQKDMAQRVLKWMELEFPIMALDVSLEQGKSPKDINMITDFDCKKPLNGRQFINKITNEVLGRPPTQQELTEFPGMEHAHDPKVKTWISEKLGTTWQSSLKQYGLKNLAYRYVNSPLIINTSLVQDPQKKSDILNEFYAKLIYYFDQKKSFSDLIMDKVVLVTEKTAPVYGCDIKGLSVTLNLENRDWYLCTMQPPRGTFFTTLGFLLSKPSSFLLENNNYGRVAAINEVVLGTTLQPNTKGPSSGNPKLPECFESKDFRVLDQGSGNYAARGTLKIPQAGTLCQSCHLDKYLAAGSLVFRPFGSTGEILTQDLLLSATSREIVPGLTQEWANALPNPSYRWMNKKTTQPDSQDLPELVTAPFLTSLLDIGKNPGQEKACIFDKKLEKEVILTSVPELMEWILKDRTQLSKGLSRMLPRAISNSSETNLEIVWSLYESYQKNNGEILSLIESYLTSKTYACGSE